MLEMEFAMPSKLCTIEQQSYPWVIEVGSCSVAQAGLECWASFHTWQKEEPLLSFGELLPPAESWWHFLSIFTSHSWFNSEVDFAST